MDWIEELFQCSCVKLKKRCHSLRSPFAMDIISLLLKNVFSQVKWT